jgi:hypothetical protein
VTIFFAVSIAASPVVGQASTTASGSGREGGVSGDDDDDAEQPASCHCEVIGRGHVPEPMPALIAPRLRRLKEVGTGAWSSESELDGVRVAMSRERWRQRAKHGTELAIKPNGRLPSTLLYFAMAQIEIKDPTSR